MPNALAYLVLLSWPLIGAALFMAMSPARALVLTILGANLILPPSTYIDLPLVPTLDKFSISVLTALFGCLFLAKEKPKLVPESPVIIGLLVIFVISPIATVFVNPEPLIFFRGFIPGMRLYDAISVIMQQCIFIIPFFLARHYLATADGHREILIGFVGAGLLYTLPVFIEVRLSPQLNVWIYGFFQHQFGQMMRAGGFRPIVFMSHGLLVALLMALCVAAAAGLRRDGPSEQRGLMTGLTAFFFGLLILCKTYAALAYGIFMLAAVSLLRPRMLLLISATLAAITLTYPILRGSGIVPVDAMVERAAELNADRAQSLGFRFSNEDMLLERAQEKPAFGWGNWGRNQIRDPLNGDIVSVTDGRWIITIGTFGWLGYIAEFGLLCLPLIMLAWRARAGPAGAALTLSTATVALMFGMNLIDNLPNASLRPFTWMMCGAILGYAERLARGLPAAVQTGPAAPVQPALRPRKTII